MQVPQIPHTFRTAGPFDLGGAQLFVSLFPTLLVLVPRILYILTLRNALLKWSPESSTTSSWS